MIAWIIVGAIALLVAKKKQQESVMEIPQTQIAPGTQQKVSVTLPFVRVTPFSSLPGESPAPWAVSRAPNSSFILKNPVRSGNVDAGEGQGGSVPLGSATTGLGRLPPNYAGTFGLIVGKVGRAKLLSPQGPA